MLLRLPTLSALLLVPAVAMAQPDDSDLTAAQREEARQHFDAGVRAFTAQNYRDCIREFELALAIRGHASILKNLGRCHEELGEVNTAIGYYERYVTEVPDAADRAQIEGRLADLRARQQPAEPPPPTEQPQQDPAAAAVEVDTGGEPALLPWILIGGGALAIGGGAVLLALDGSCDPDSPTDAAGNCARLRDTFLSGVLILGVGAVTAGIGGYLLLSGGDKEAAQAFLRDPVLRF